MQRVLKACFVFVAAISAVSAQAANSITQVQTLGQSAFRDLSEDLGAALSYKPLGPAEPLGITGFDVGLDASVTQFAHAQAILAATGNTGSSFSLLVPRLHVQKGLPFNIDVGLAQTSVPGTNIKVTGGELRYAFLEGGLAMPAVAARLSMTKLSGVDQLDFKTKSLDISISKGFAMFKPYAGIGRVWVDSTPLGNAAAAPASLTPESMSLGKTFVGANVTFLLAAIGVEVDRTGSARTTSLKLALRW
ncbi:MAG: hypothetical protein OEW21_11450 [Betaproteobacteria bacterium]|nr:hypothetical protein [Betaproteobacteria bacterium]